MTPRSSLLLLLLAGGCARAKADSAPPVAAASATAAASAASAPPEPTPPPPPAPTAGITCPAGEVAIPPTGPEGFTMGRGIRGATDRAHRVVLTHGFCLDETEVTVRAYKECVDAGTCQLPFQGDQFATYPRFPDHPVNMVSWSKARVYCATQGKRLPSEAEWEWAAAGPEGRKYPWGNDPEPACGVELADFTPLGAPKSNPGGDVGCFGGGPSAVKAHPKGARHWPGGDLYDLAGNVWEWVEDSYAPLPTEPMTDPLVRAETAIQAIRGGGWNRPARALETAFRGAAVFTYQVPGLGFRCARGEAFATPPPRQKPSP